MCYILTKFLSMLYKLMISPFGQTFADVYVPSLDCFFYMLYVAMIKQFYW